METELGGNEGTRLGIVWPEEEVLIFLSCHLDWSQPEEQQAVAAQA